MKNRRIEKIDRFIGHMEKMDDYFFEGEISVVGIYLIYGGRSLKLTFCPEVVELLQAAVDAEREYWEED